MTTPNAQVAVSKDERHKFYANLTNEALLHMALEDAKARFSQFDNPALPQGRLANQSILHTRVKNLTLDQEGDRWLGTMPADRPYDEYSAGKLVTVEYTEVDSHRADPRAVAALNNPTTLASRKGIKALDWPGAVFRSESFTRTDGTTLTVRVGGSSSGVQGYIDQAVSAAGADTYVALWLLREKARDILGMPPA